MRLQDKTFEFTQKLEKLLFVRTLRGALLSLIPVLMIGAFALIGRSFPITAYQKFITSFSEGLIYTVFNMIYTATFGMLSVYMTFCITVSYRRESNRQSGDIRTAEMSGLVNFFILSGIFSDNFTISALGTKGMITAIIAGYFSAVLYYRFYKIAKPHRYRLYSDGADSRFNSAVASIFIAFLTIIVFTAMNSAICVIFKVSTFWELITKSLTSLFLMMDNGFFSGILFVLASSILWFFGIHGSDCLEGVMENTYTPMIQVNASAVEAGSMPTEILTKQFFDIFVFMGGCGTAICLLLALFIFGRRRSDRELSSLSALPMLFNINETMIFGLPVIFNPVLFVPFVLTPLVSYTSAYLAMKAGIVGLTVSSVEWTTPVLLGGYISTAGISGLLMQLFNMVIGVMIYAPFIRLLDNQKLYMSKLRYNELVRCYQDYENSGKEIILTNIDNAAGDVAKQLVFDLKDALENNSIKLYYQPQALFNGTWKGAEALMRWDHKLFGMIYPPLAIKIASESGCLEKLEKSMIRLAASEYSKVCEKLGDDAVVSVNITNPTLSGNGFSDFISSIIKEYEIPEKCFCLEVTEQTAFIVDDRIDKVMNEIKNVGVLFAIDDFSMGQTSVKYLENKHFDHIKLDGSLVSEIIKNPRCFDIISSIVSLSGTLGIDVIAEYVETPEQREKLALAGCLEYQGYLYSPAVPLEKLGNIRVISVNKH